MKDQQQETEYQYLVTLLMTGPPYVLKHQYKDLDIALSDAKRGFTWKNVYRVKVSDNLFQGQTYLSKEKNWKDLGEPLEERTSWGGHEHIDYYNAPLVSYFSVFPDLEREDVWK